MKIKMKITRFRIGFSALAIIFSISGSALAIDDGARAYWNGRDGTDAFSFQYLNLNMQATETTQFAPGQYIYPNADTEASIAMATWAHHMTVLGRASSFAVNLVGGSIDVAVDPDLIPAGDSLHQSASGYADPTVQYVMNLYGTSQLKSTVDLLNYEPGFTADIAAMLAVPVGQYDSDSLVNMGQNRWFGRIALPMKYHFGAFAPGYMNSLEITPSTWLFAENDDLQGNSQENDPLWQLEGHLTHDFTPTCFGSLDLLYRGGFQSEINGAEVGDELNIGDVGFTLSYQLTDNAAIRTSYSSNVFGDTDLDSSMIRLQFVYGWHTLTENTKKLQQGH
jgi:hypothetical protein